MTPQERELLDGLFARIRTAAGSPRDPEAEAFITEAARQQPYATYLLAQTVIVQEETLKAAAARLEELEGKVRELEEKAAAAAAAPTSFLGGVGKSLFGGAPQQAAPQSPGLSPRASVPSTGVAGAGIAMPNAPRPGARWTQQGQPVNAAEPQSQQQGGNSFLKGALGAAAGVAGGMLLANSLSGLFGGGGAQAGDKAAPAAGEAARSNPWGSDRESGNRSAADDGFSGSEDAGADDAWAEEDAWGADDDGDWGDED